MPIINGLQTANCGEIKELLLYDPIRKTNKLVVEVLRPERHNPYCEIICYYFLNENRNKVEITLYKNLKDGTYGSEIYFFKTASDTQHYRSMNYINLVGLPKKYEPIVNELFAAHKQIFR